MIEAVFYEEKLLRQHTYIFKKNALKNFTKMELLQFNGHNDKRFYIGNTEEVKILFKKYIFPGGFLPSEKFMKQFKKT